MPRALPIGKQKAYTTERMQELHHKADLVGDVASRDKLAAMIVAQGGTVFTGKIPKNETKLGRLERLQQDALDVNDTDSAEKIGLLIAEAQVKENGIVPETESEMESKTPSTSLHEFAEDEIPPAALKVAGISPPLNGGMNVHTDRESDDDAIARLMKDSDDKLAATVAKGTEGYEAIDLEPTEGPIASPVNDGTASVNAKAMIDREGYRIEEIPARFSGKLDVTDVKRYAKLLTEVQS